MNFIGADGCKEGWFYVQIDGISEWNIGIVRNSASLWEICSEASLTLVDIPIGLPYAPEGRLCDVAARKLLGRGRASSVFPVPCREAVRARNYEEACKINEGLLGKKLSQQAWNISTKIREVDDLLSYNDNASIRIRETHPEICFWALAGGTPMKHPKKKPKGFSERLNLLRRVFSQCDSIVENALKRYRRKELAKDDILDSLVAAVTASCPGDYLSTIPENPEKDLHNLPIEMVFNRINLMK